MKGILQKIGVVALVAVLMVGCFACGTTPSGSNGNHTPADLREYKLTGGNKAIIILPGLLASGLMDADTGEMVWDPFCKPEDDDLDLLMVMGAYGEEHGMAEFIGNLNIFDAMGYANACLEDALDNPSVLRRIMCDEEGNPIYNVVGVPYRDYQGHQRYGALNSYRTLALGLQERYGDTYEVIVFNYNWLADTRRAAKLLEDFVKANNITESILVAHSMGGIVATEYLAASAENRARIDKFVAIGTPFYGSYMVNDWFEDPQFLRDMAIPTLEQFGLSSFIETFNNMFDNVVIPLLFNMTTMYQLLPGANLVSLSAQAGFDAITVDGQALTPEELYDFYLTRPWSTLQPMATVEEAASLATRKQMVDWPAYHQGFYVQKGDQQIYAADLVDTYYIVGNGVATTTGLVYTPNGMTVRTTLDGDGTVPLLSATRGKAVDNEHVFRVDGVSHIPLGCYYDLISTPLNAILG